MNEPPLKPPPPSPVDPPARRNWLGLGLMVLFLSTILGVMAIVAPLLVIIVVVIFFVAGCNYLIWGWWLGAALRREAEEDDRP